MVEEQIEARGVRDKRVLAAVREVPRHLFVPESQWYEAYADRPLPIGHGQTISQPYIVALMTELLRIEPGDKILEVGTGSGYQAAILARITTNIFTIEIIKELADAARKRLAAAGFPPERVICGDGYAGLPEEAPFDGIIVTAAPDHIPQPLVDQLKPGARLVVPVGESFGAQDLKVVLKRADGSVETEDIIPVRFVPLTGDGVHKGGR
jgi:protein-L-isoaspartate(D-aspartate) O-methyltransferase